MTLAAVELGGTKALVTVGREAGARRAPIQIATSTPAATIPAIVAALRESASPGDPIEAIGIASFGPLQLDSTAADYGRMLHTPKLGWAGVDLIGPFRDAFDVAVALETDVNAAALAEGRWGAAMGADTHAYITVGTGVGVGLVVDGAIVRGAGHSEGGHLLVRTRADDAFPGTCRWHGRCVEGLTSGVALNARLGCDGAEISPGDPVWDLCGDYLAQLCAALVLLQVPRRIVVGGGVGRRPELLQAVRTHLRKHLNGYIARLDDAAAVEALVVPAALEHSGLIGALLIAAGVAR